MKIEDGLYNILNPLSLALYVRISIAVYGKYRAALRHIDCAFGANIDLLEYIFLRPLSLALYVRISIAVRQISRR